ncbi:hypothetical protein CI238_11898 [Colletotrichum incanum]|uniref:Uncharacterized protein n=1 Tax=Colletotrichum incanum TaxID=1573173 RepID=A0A167BMF9_COLIC|nr:hypothetical protein CI238_11898 [Colletotrichum incanum]OHW89541.1 transposase [Colletotrichum incanum]
MAIYDESHILKAIEAVHGGKSIRQASKIWGVPSTTIHRRMKGGFTRNEAQAPKQRLSPRQEGHLASWILTQAAIGFAPNHRHIHIFATRTLRASSNTQPLGRKWIEGFLRRNPSYKTVRAKKIDAKRVKGVTEDIVKQSFKILQLPDVKIIPISLRWNIYETGIAEGAQKDYLVTSIVKSISTASASLPPLIIFKGKTVQQQ